MFKKIKKIIRDDSHIVHLLYLLRFFITFVLIIFTVILHNRQKSSELSKFEALEKERVFVLKNNMEGISDLVIGDLFVAENHFELLNYLKDESGQVHTDHSIDDHKQNLVNELMVMSGLRKSYDQIRLIDIDGNEIIRVNHRAGLTYITPEDKLQNKFDRYYFQEAISLNQGEVFVSPIDLNVENGEIEFPRKPMIRVATPLFYEGEKKGIIIFNYLAQELLDSLENRLEHEGEQIYLVNEEGYWIKGPESDLEWGFMFEDPLKTIFEWDTLFNLEVLSENKHQGLHQSGLFTHSTVEPFNYSGGVKKKLTIFSDNTLKMDKKFSHQWKIISFLPRDILFKQSNQLLLIMILANVIITIFLITSSSILISSIRGRLRSEKIISKLNETLRIITKVLRHDLANDFTHINFALELFNENKKDKSLLEEISKSANHGIGVIGQMRELEGMISQGEKLKSIDIIKLLREVTKEYKIKFKITGKGIVKADEGLGSVFHNLISNAINHGRTKKMDIQISNENNQTVVKFIDYGIGVPKDIKKDIFKEGFKFGETGNTGLGLYIVEQTMKRYEGEIYVEDSNPSGATFIVKFKN